MAEWHLIPDGVVPEWTTPGWYAQQPNSLMADGPCHGPRVQVAADMTSRVAHQIGARSVIDVGAGDGGLLQRCTLPEGCMAWGYDLQPSHVDYAAERGVEVHLVDVLADPAAVAWGLDPRIVVCTEMLEHLLDPRAFLRSLPAGWGVFSSPAKETGDAHYEHHVWAWDLDGYRALLEGCGWTVTEQVEVPPIFQVVTAHRA